VGELAARLEGVVSKCEEVSHSPSHVLDTNANAGPVCHTAECTRG
jgi:hypothetical protein